MMLITFNVGQDRYAQKVHTITEIIPMVNLNKIPLSEKYIKGVFNYRGDPVPVIDLCELYTGEPCAERMSTRIIIVNYEDHNQQTHTLGLIAEKVTESINMDMDEFKPPGINIENAPFLAGIANDEHGLIQLVEPDKILPEDVSDKLFGQVDASLAG
jgi:chemotaxis-related protein WspB